MEQRTQGGVSVVTPLAFFLLIRPSNKGNFAPAGATRAALERAPWTPPNFLLSPRSKQEPPPDGAAAPLHSVFRVTPSRVKG